VSTGENGASVDYWEAHWRAYAESTSDNPAQEFRRQLIAHAVRRQGSPAQVLDIGSGQGDLLASLRAEWPEAELAGLELSAEGIRRAVAKVPGARFWQIDLLTQQLGAPEIVDWAEVAICSEVLEHVDDPSRLLRNAARYVAPGGLVVVTVPGGPRTAFDRHIGHRRHYRPHALRAVVEQAGLDVVDVHGAGFPFFNAYKFAVLLRGKALARDVSVSAPHPRLAKLVMSAFGVLLRPRLNASRFGWQLVALARRPGGPQGVHA
jgi:SAM-dependent methyltransferase